MSAKPKILTEKFEDFTARLDWRWERVQALFMDDKRPVSGFDDPTTVRAFKFIKAFQDTENVSDRQMLTMQYPNEVRAYNYYLNGDDRRFKLESLCLCDDVTQHEIAVMLDEDQKVINLFEKFFFDVRDKKKTALFNLLFPPGVFENALGTNLTDKIWKFIAMTAGFRCLQCMIDPSILDGASDHYFVNMANRNHYKMYGIGGLVNPLKHRGDLLAINETVLKVVELEIKERAEAGSQLPEAQQSILTKCMEAIHVQVMDPDYKLESPYEPTVEHLLARPEPAPVPIVA